MYKLQGKKDTRTDVEYTKNFYGLVGEHLQPNLCNNVFFYGCGSTDTVQIKHEAMNHTYSATVTVHSNRVNR